MQQMQTRPRGENVVGIKLAPVLTLMSVLLWGQAAIGIAGGSEQAEGDAAAIERYSHEAQQALAARNLDAAARALEKLAALTPDAAEVEVSLGNVYYAQSRYSKALEAFQKAVKANPEVPNGRLMVALCDAQLGHWESARPELESAFQHPPGPEAQRMIGIELMGVDWSLHQGTAALQVTEELLQRYPRDPEILYRATHAYDARALEIMNDLVHAAPGSPWANMAFAESLEGQGHYDLAISAYRKVIAADPAIPKVRYRLGRALLLNSPDNPRTVDDALKEFQTSVVVNPLDAGAEYEIGEIYRRRGDQEQAVRHFLRATEIDPSFEEAQIGVARTLLAAGKPREAVPHLRAAISSNPANEVSHFLLAKAHRLLGDETGSERELALYQECHARALREAFGKKGQAPTPGEGSSVVMKQTLGPDEHP